MKEYRERAWNNMENQITFEGWTASRLIISTNENMFPSISVVDSAALHFSPEKPGKAGNTTIAIVKFCLFTDFARMKISINPRNQISAKQYLHKYFSLNQHFDVVNTSRPFLGYIFGLWPCWFRTIAAK